MILLKDLYNFVSIISNKEQSGSSGLSPEQFNQLCPRAVDDFFKFNYGLPEDYKPGRPLPDIGWEQTQYIKDALKDLLSDPILVNVDSKGQASYPDDYIHVSSAYYQYVQNVSGGDPKIEEVSIDFVRDNEYVHKLRDPIAPPTVRYPIGVQYKSYIQFNPKSLSRIYLVYFKYPVAPELVYTLDPDTDEVVIDDTATTNIDLPQNHTNDIARILLGYIGINLSNDRLWQYARVTQEKGV